MTPYILNINNAMFKQIRKAISIVILTAFISTSVKSPAYAQLASADPMPFMPKPGVMVHLSPEFTPAYLKGIVVHPENALKFDFIIYKGDQKLSDAQKREEYTKLAKYFLASLAIPDDDQWVNLSPYEKDRIIKDDFGKTEMGRDLLAQDYMLKQITASLIYPENNLGKKFWDRVYAQAQKQYGTTDIPVNTFNKVWILPDDALIYEKGNTAYVLKNHLRVMLEEDYLSLQKHAGIQSEPVNNTHSIASKIVKEIVLPELEREVNEDRNFAAVRQVYSGMLLAAWYKRALQQSLLSKIYADKAKVKGVDQDPKTNEQIYRQYLRAYKKGVFNFIKEDVDKYTNETIPRKYFSGGTIGYTTKDFAQVVHIEHAMLPDQAKTAQNELRDNKIDYAEVAAEERRVVDVAQQAANPAMSTDAGMTANDAAMTIDLKTPVDYKVAITETQKVLKALDTQLTLSLDVIERARFSIEGSKWNGVFNAIPFAHRKLKYYQEVTAGNFSKFSNTDNYSLAWVRDTLWASMVDEVNGNEDNVRTTYGALLQFFGNQTALMEKSISKAKRGEALSPEDAIMPRMNPLNLEGIPADEQKSLQFDGIGLFLFNVARLYKQGINVLKDASDVQTIRLMIDYLKAWKNWETADFGVWEEGPELHTSSIGIVLAGLKEINNLSGVARDGEKFAFTVNADEISRGQAAFRHQLETVGESVQRPVDMTGAILVYLNELASDKFMTSQESSKLLEGVKDNLVRTRGVLRYMGHDGKGGLKDIDGYWMNTDTGKSAEWPLGLGFLAAVYAKQGDAVEAKKYLDQLHRTTTGLGIPESYLGETAKSTPNNPLTWASAMEIVANRNLKDLLTKEIANLQRKLAGETQGGDQAMTTDYVIARVQKFLEGINKSGYDVSAEQAVAGEATVTIKGKGVANIVPQIERQLPHWFPFPLKITATVTVARKDQVIFEIIDAPMAEKVTEFFKVVAALGWTYSSVSLANVMLSKATLANFLHAGNWEWNLTAVSVGGTVVGLKALYNVWNNWYGQRYSSKTDSVVWGVIGTAAAAATLWAALSIPVPRKVNRYNYSPIIQNNRPRLIDVNNPVNNPGGIDFNAANLNLQIRRDGHGVPLPISQQDLDNIHIDGLVPIIIDIKPATSLPIFSELQVH